MGLMIAVIGGGTWGTALAQIAADAGHQVVLWAREAQVVDSINNDHVNQRFLPDQTLPLRIKATADLGDTAGYDLALITTPAQHMRVTMQAWCAYAKGPMLLCTKGIEQKTGLLMHQVVGEVLTEFGQPLPSLGALSGPTFASELIKRFPAAATIAFDDETLSRQWAQILRTSYFRPYSSDDVVGCMVGGAVKNVIAIGCGIVEGLGLGDNARVALLTRGFREMARLATNCGGRLESMSGLAGFGDLCLTCTSHLSRNLRLGLALGQGQSIDVLRDQSTQEGFFTADSVAILAADKNVSMPICLSLRDILWRGVSIDDTIATLLGRPLVREDD